jgi:FMN reductase
MHPRIVALGGTLRPSSSGSAALRLCLNVAQEHGCDVQLLTGPDLDVPMYDPSVMTRSLRAVALLAALRDADGILIASPGYHGSVSGLVKNALDYTEDLRREARCYLSDVPVGCIVSAAGWQAAGATLTALRAIVHALRGWPTPLGVMFKATATVFDPNGDCPDEELHAQLCTMTMQVVTMAKLQLRLGTESSSAESCDGAGENHDCDNVHVPFPL